MIAFALERSGFGVTSGISATAGERNIAIETSTKRSISMKITSIIGFAFVTSHGSEPSSFESCISSATERMTSPIAAAIVPTRMNGVLRPSFPICLSDIAPNSGRRNTARTLSSAMTAPDQT